MTLIYVVTSREIKIMEEEILKLAGSVILIGIAVCFVVLPVLTAIILEFLYGSRGNHVKHEGKGQ